MSSLKQKVEYENELISYFWEDVKINEMMEKCFRCVMNGLLYCKYWSLDWSCNVYEARKEVESLKEIFGDVVKIV